MPRVLETRMSCVLRPHSVRTYRRHSNKIQIKKLTGDTDTATSIIQHNIHPTSTYVSMAIQKKNERCVCVCAVAQSTVIFI